MRKIVLLLLTFIVLTGCASVKTSGKSMAEDLGSPEKVELLRERAVLFWSALVNRDYEKVYSIYDPFYRTHVSLKSFRLLQPIKYHEFEIKDIKVEGNVAKVGISTVYSLPMTKVKKQQFSIPETPAEFEETWLYIYDNWYKEYYMESLNKSFVEY
jgi:hypothetical protein